MKRRQTFLAPLLSLSFLVSCGGNKRPEDVANFFVENPEAQYNKNDKTAKFTLDHNPSGHSVEISHLSYTCTCGGTKVTPEITPTEPTDARPLEITITFQNDLTKTSDDGVLKFHFFDKTANVEDDTAIKRLVITVEE